MCRSRVRATVTECKVSDTLHDRRSADATGCGRAARPSLDDDARQYVRLAVALGERDPDSLDFYAGPPEAVADVRRSPPSLTAIRQDAEALLAHVSSAAHDSPTLHAPTALAADLAAIVARVNLLTGARLPYDDESRAFFGIAPGPPDESRLGVIRSQIARVVGGDGRLVDRYASFAARFTIPADRLPAVMDAAVDECRRRTVAHVALPPGEGVTLEFVRDKPWSAFSRYAGDGRSVLQINTDFRFTVDQALQVACHEGYPGHHARNVLRAPNRDDGVWPERLVQLTFSPESLASEASAMLAVDVAFPPETARGASSATGCFRWPGSRRTRSSGTSRSNGWSAICRWSRPTWRDAISTAISSSRARSRCSRTARSCRTPRRSSSTSTSTAATSRRTRRDGNCSRRASRRAPAGSRQTTSAGAASESPLPAETIP